MDKLFMVKCNLHNLDTNNNYVEKLYSLPQGESNDTYTCVWNTSNF